MVGMPLVEVVGAATAAPAAAIGRSDSLGCLKPGREADVTVLELDRCVVQESILGCHALFFCIAVLTWARFLDHTQSATCCIDSRLPHRVFCIAVLTWDRFLDHNTQDGRLRARGRPLSAAALHSPAAPTCLLAGW